MLSWILPIFLGLGLAAASGLRTFLPLLMLAIVARLGLFGVALNEHFSWLGSTAALVALSVATVVELCADKIPVVDHALSAIGTVSRPLAGALAAGAVLTHADPSVAVLSGLIIGAPTAFAIHTAQSGARVVSTATTAGLGNPVVSVMEDIASAFTAGLALVAPILAPIAVAGLLFVAWRAWSMVRRRTAG
jgi:uncharacterized membrane protein